MAMKSATRSLALDQFLGHQTRSARSNFLSGWRKKTPPEVNVVLHRQAPIVALWQHPVPRIFVQKDDKKGRAVNRVFGGNFNCLEDESVLTNQYKRDKDTGLRKSPPVVCPMCRLLETLYMYWQEGELLITTPVFTWEGDLSEETTTLTLGGMLNLYGKKDLSEADEDAISEARVHRSEAWKENAMSKCNYVFSVVDNDDPEAGVQVAIETAGLGAQVKELIFDEITSQGEDDGNPLVNPYVIRWRHIPNAAEISKRYKAIAMRKSAISPKALELIDGEPPDLSNVTAPGNITKLRAELESRCVLPDPSILPWDDIFGPAELAGYGADAEAEAELDAEEEGESETPPAQVARKTSVAVPRGAKREPEAEAAEAAPVAAPSGRKRKQAEPEPEPEPETAIEDDVEMVKCDECGADMRADETVCQACGAEYELQEVPAAKPAATTAAKPAATTAAKPAATTAAKPAVTTVAKTASTAGAQKRRVPF